MRRKRTRATAADDTPSCGNSPPRNGITAGNADKLADSRRTGVPPGAPGWVTPELIDLTIRTWQPYYRTPLSPDDALTMILNVGRLYGVLSGDRKS